MTDYELDPLTGDPIAKSGVSKHQQPDDNRITEAEMEKLGGMSREGLIALVERFARQCGMVSAMSEEETAQAMLDVLAHTALKPIIAGVNMRADIQSRLAAIDKWLDRTKGKPVANVKVDNTIQMLVSNVKTDQALLGRIRQELIAGTIGDVVING